MTPAVALILGGCAIIAAAVLSAWLPGIVLGAVVVALGIGSVVGS